MKKYSDFSNIDKNFKELKKKLKKKPKKNKKPLYITLFLIIFFVAFIGFMLPIAGKLVLLDVFLTLTPGSNLISDNNILILGIDSNRGTHRSDTIMVAKIDPKEKEVKLLSIPRDTLVIIPGRGLDKVNHAFVYGGVELSRTTIASFLQVPIPYYITIDIGGLAHLIDKLGGVTINVEKRMYYVDYAGGLYVDLQPGLQRLSGSKAVGYVRFRHDSEGDLGRIKRQQQFLRAFTSQLTKRSNILKSPGLILSILKEVQTNLSLKEILGLAMAVRSAHDLGRIKMASLPGKDLMIDEIYYWKPDWEKSKSIIREFLKQRNNNYRSSNFPIIL